MSFFRSRAFSAANAVSLLMYFGMFGSIFLLAQFFQVVQGYSPFQAGLRTLPWTGMPIIVAPIAGVLADRIGGRPILATGMALQAVALGWLAAVVTPTVPYEDMIVPFILAGIGMGLFFAPIANVVLSAVRPEQEGKASGATNTIREVGGVFGVAVLAAIFSANGRLHHPDRVRRGDAAGDRDRCRRGRPRAPSPRWRSRHGPVLAPSSTGRRRRPRPRRPPSTSSPPRPGFGAPRAGQGTRHIGRVPCSHAIRRPSRHRRRRHGPARPPLAARRGRGRRRVGGQAVGLGPAGPRSCRALRDGTRRSATS